MEGLTGMQQKLYEYLKQVRYDQAKKENKRAYWILTNKSLADFVIKMPGNKDEMLAVFGVGPSTAEAYADLFIGEMKKYLMENGANIEE